MTNWSTPSTHDGRRPGSDDTSTQGRNLKRAAENFLADAEHTIGGGNLTSTPKHTGGIDLEGAAELWGTPTSRDEKDGGGNDGEHASQWASRAPGSRALFPPGPGEREAWREIISERPDLAPAVEYQVRGVADGTTGKLDFARADQLRSLGNMVVPMQGALALLVLLDRVAQHKESR